MATSAKPDNMKLFGKVMTEMFYWMADNQPQAASDWLDKLSAIKWKNYLTQKEAELIVSEMDPEAPWDYEQWESAMEKHGYQLDHEPCYNRYALFVVMNSEMSDSGESYKKYIDDSNLFSAVHDFAVNKLLDKDKKYNVRKYFIG